MTVRVGCRGDVWKVTHNRFDEAGNAMDPTSTSVSSDMQPTPQPATAVAKSAIFFFDVVSPYAYLMYAMLRKDPLPIPMTARPVLFAGLLNAHGTKGPAEVPLKRQHSYELCTWLAQTQGILFQMPAAHPFNPIRFLRFIIARGCAPEAIAAVFDALYTAGADPDDPAVWKHLASQEVNTPHLEAMLEAPSVKLELRTNTEEALKAGVFGVPTILIGERLFWGVDSLPMLRAYLAGDASLSTPQMKAARAVRLGIERKEF
jgi:2-hydroxychromene-2-carboxylate isomerase